MTKREITEKLIDIMVANGRFDVRGENHRSQLIATMMRLNLVEVRRRLAHELDGRDGRHQTSGIYEREDTK